MRQRHLIAAAILLLSALPALGQWIPCLGDVPSGQTPPPIALPTVPELVSSDGRLRATVVLVDEQERMTFKVPPGAAPSDTNTIKCAPQYVRVYKGVDAKPPYPKPESDYPDPMPGPTLRARVGDYVELTFLNQVNPANFGNSIDRGEHQTGTGCDETSLYPGTTGDTYPDCFHGSSTANIHFHGTHTNPNSTGDNVFLEIRPSLRADGKPVVTEKSVKASFGEFFKQCETHLQKSVLSEWPLKWDDFPASYRMMQKRLLQQYDQQKDIKPLWPVDAAQIAKGDWPQYYLGAYPYCYRLPSFTGPYPPPPPSSGTHGGHTGGPMSGAPPRALQMGQAPGTHWYHAHKHGSTALNVANGMTGAFIIEGQYDDDIDTNYGKGWTRKQPVLVINQLGMSPNLMRGGGGRTDKGPNFSVNGRMRPTMTMAPGEVKMWRMVNTSGRAFTYFLGPPQGFNWMQLAQDGVQLNDTNYQASKNTTLTLAPGNRADLLVQAPTTAGTYGVMVKNEVDPTDLPGQNAVTLFYVQVTGTQMNMSLMPHAPTFPAFLTDINPSSIKVRRKITFASTPPVAKHTIDGKTFDGEVGEVVLLNTVEEWTVYNETFGAIPPAQGPPMISHPFHIHINPFQITEVFSPAETFTAADGKTLPRYVYTQTGIQTGQCYLDPNGDPKDYKPCTAAPKTNLVWWDTFPIPSGVLAVDAGGNPVKGANGNQLKVPGWFRFRSRFVDFPGFYVIHCHILAHEDRGMMTVVEVAPTVSPYSHD